MGLAPALLNLTLKKKLGKTKANSDKESGSQKPSEGWMDRQTKHSQMRVGWESYNILPWGKTPVHELSKEQTR